MDKEAVLMELVLRFLERFDLRPMTCYFVENADMEDPCHAAYPDKVHMWCDPCLITKAVEDET